MTPRYAASTTVTPDRSRAEIERTLRRYGADQFIYGWEQAREQGCRQTNALIGFRINSYQIRISLQLPDPDAFAQTPRTGKTRSKLAASKAYDQAERQAWRALLLVIKAKLEAAEAGITTIEEQFLSDIVLPDNTTLGQRLIPQLQTTVKSGNLPPMLPNAAGPAHT